MPRIAERGQGSTTTTGSPGATARGDGANGVDPVVQELLDGLTAAVGGDFSVRLSARKASAMGQVAARYNELMEANARMAKELAKVARVVGREGRMTQRMSLGGAQGDWASSVESVNSLIDDLVRPTTEVTRALVAVADGDLSQKMALEVEGRPVKGEFLRIRTVVNTMVDQLGAFADEVTRVAREVGTEGKLGGQAKVKGVSGTWRDLTDSVNSMAGNLTDQVRNIAEVTTAVARGDLSKKITVEARGEVAALAGTINTMVDQLRAFADEVTRVAKEVGTEGRLGGQADVKGVLGTWKDLTESVNYMAGNLTDQVRNIASVATAVARGDLSKKITVEARGEVAVLADTINTMVDQLRSFAAEVTRVAKEVGTEGKLGGQAEVEGVSGTWKGLTDNVNSMAGNLTDQVRNIAEVTTAVAQGDLSKKITVGARGEILELKNTINTMVDQLGAFADEVTRVAKEVGTEGKLGGQAEVEGVSGTWKGLTDNVNSMAGNLTDQVRNIAEVTTAVAQGDLSKKITVEARGEVAALAGTINTMVDQLGAFADEVTRVAREVGTEGRLGGQADVKGVLGTWKDLTESVNDMAGNLTDQVRSIASVATAVARGDLSKKITVEARGEVAALAGTINTMVDQLSSFAAEVTRVAREVGTEGRLGGQADVKGVLGTWKDLTESVNYMAGNLTDQVRDIASVTTAVARGDLSQKITVDVKGEILQLKNTINSMVDQLRSFAAEVTRVAREVGTEGRLGGQAEVEGVSGTWRGLTDNVNSMAGNLTDQVRNIAHVATAVARGDLSQKITVEAKGEVAALATTINSMVDQLRSFAAEVTRVAREVGTEGKLGGQAEVEGVSGTWKGLTDNVNSMAGNLTDQVRNIAEVTTAVARGDLSKKITVGARGEILQLKNTINTMVDQLGAFAAEVTRVAREVGTEGKLGGQAEVEGVSGTWRRLTENVNQLAANLTNQVRAIAEVSTAVTSGDLTRSIAVEASGEVAELKDNINQMIANLKETTDKNAEQDWLKTNLARISRMMQGQRDLQAVSRLIMSELTPMVSAQHGAFFLADNGDGDQPVLRMIASYGYTARKSVANCFTFGESLVGQAALEATSILVTEAPPDYVRISSGLGSAPPVNLVVLPVLFEDQVLGVIELASFRPFSEVHQTFLDQVMETVGIVLNTIVANSRTEELLTQSQRLAKELQNQSEELQTQQEELQQTNEELQEKASLLEQQNRNIEVKNQEIELARVGLEEKAQQLALSSRYKSEFLANMSHELRTPLNSLLILAKLLADNPDHNLTDKQVEFARTIHSSGHDLLELINDILDLSKIEAGRMDVHPAPMAISEVVAEVDQAFRLVAEQKGLTFEVRVDEGAPASIVTDRQRLLQVLKNLCSNACKFTDAGTVRLTVTAPPRTDGEMVAFEVADTGIGIPADKLQLIFEAFQQADGTTSRRYGGTGLGLSISREITRLLGGTIEARSVEGEGSTFTFRLPVTYVGTAPSPPPAPPVLFSRSTDGPAPVVEGDGQRPRRLLVVDDDPVERESIAGLVSDSGVEVSAVGTSAEAIERLERARFDGVILDLHLDGTTGFDFLEQIKADRRFSSLPVVVHTAKDLTRREETRLKKHTGSIVLKTAASRERLLEEVAAMVRPARPDANEEDDNHGPVPVPRGDDVFADRQVLIVDDDVRNVFALTSALEGLGMEVLFAENGREGLELVEQHPAVDVVLMDIMMPEMDGYEAIRAIRAMPERQQLPIIALTAKAMAEDRDRTVAAGASDYITKPVDVDQLVSLLRVWLYE